MKKIPKLGLLTFLLLIISLYMVFLYAPEEKVMGEIQRIFYFHVASAWLALFAYTVTFICSILYLVKKERKFDTIALSSAEIGVFFTTFVLISGPLWARPIWNTWWTWDPRLTSSLALWLMFVAYLILRANIPDSPKKFQVSSVYAIIAYLDVPIVFFSIRWWRTIHPVVITSKHINLDPKMLQTLIISNITFTLLYFLLLKIDLKGKNLSLKLDKLINEAEELIESKQMEE